jgi:hypothetical protein
MHLLLQLLDLCSDEKKRGNVGFAFAGGVPKGKILCYHALLINEGSKLQDIVLILSVFRGNGQEDQRSDKSKLKCKHCSTLAVRNCRVPHRNS